MKKYTFLLFVIASLALQGCMYQQAESIANKDIDPKLREIIKAKNDSLFNALSNSSSKVLEKLGSPKFVKFMHSRLEGVIWPFRKGYLTTDYVVYDEFYNHHSTVPDNSVIAAPQKGYTFTFQNQQKETYVSLLKCTYQDMEDYVVAVIYSNINGEWKIEEIKAGQLGIYGKTPNDLYNEAQQLNEKGFSIDAISHIDAANSFLDPLENMLKYDEDKRIRYYQKDWAEKLNSTVILPYELREIHSKPVIGGITSVKNTEGFYPLINYITIVPVQDTLALGREFERVKAETEKAFPQIDFKQKYIYYRAYNKDPETDILNKNYTFTVKK